MSPPGQCPRQCLDVSSDDRAYCARMKIAVLCSLVLFAGSSRAQNQASPQTQQVTMRDGIRLATDIYGAEPGVRRPALLLRTPYNKRAAKATAERFAAAAYVAAVQD